MFINKGLEIVPLGNCPKHLPSLAKLWHEEISRHWNANATIENAEERLLTHLNTNQMPIAFAALKDNNPVGMACLRESDGIWPGTTPWLGSLVVNPQYRGQKIGETLINTVKLNAKKMGYENLFLLTFDSTIPTWYSKLGWQIVGYDTFLDNPITVMSISL